MSSTVTTKSVYISTKPHHHRPDDRMCFREPKGKNYYYHAEEHIPVRRHAHYHHGHSHGHHHHHHSSSRSSMPVYVTHSPRVSSSSYRASGPVMYETRTSTTRYRN